MNVNASVFQQYSATMPGVLTLLVTYDYGATFFKNIQRLMGVTLGLTLPLLVMSVLSLFPCDSHFRFFFHVIALFTFNFMFTFMYYSSEQWSTIGVCIVGFGCYPMFHQCDASQTEGSLINYSAQYKYIAQVIIAILLKMFVANLMAPAESRDVALNLLDKLCTSVTEAYKAFILGDVTGEQGLKAKRDEVKKYILDCEAIYPKCEPGLQIVPGTRTPFKFELYGKALQNLRLVLSDLDMLVLAMTGHEEVHMQEVKISASDKLEDEQNVKTMEEQEKALHKIIEEQPAWKKMSTDLLDTVEAVFDMLKTVLAHDTEEPLNAAAVEKLKQMDRLVELEGVEDFYSE